MSLSLPLHPASTKPFRFLDLPGEIRDKVYEIILCAADLPPVNDTGFHEVPTELIKLRHSIEPQILRTCRSIYIEGNYVLRKTNLFIKVTVKIPFEEISRLLVIKRVPILPINRERVKNFKAFVMSHEITPSAPIAERSRTFVLLYRDLSLFCRALADGKQLISRHDELVSHIVTLVDPYESEDLPASQTFYSHKLQEKLIAPYRAELHGFSRFKIKGAIPKDLKATAESEIARPPTEDPDSVLRELEEMKLKGNEYFRNGDTSMASESWAKACMKLSRVMGGSSGRKLREAGGVDFLNRVTELFFDISSNRAQNTIKAMRANLADPELVRALAQTLFHAIDNAAGATEEYQGITWQPSPQQLAKLRYREAFGCRLVGRPEFLHRGEVAIGAALLAMPGDAEIEREKERISQWRRRISS